MLKLTALTTFAFALNLSTAQAQTPQAMRAQDARPASALRAESAQSPDSRPEPRIEKIIHEDAGSRIDELRVAGETKSITVTPKGGMPAYDVGITNNNRPSGSAEREMSNGPRGWKILGF
jgi:hypothetical protein